ncbi:MAG: hypothetical protein ABI478_01320 [Propionivibrio sp.]
MPAARLLQALLWLVYPLAIYFGLKVFEPRSVALLLAAALLLRRRRDAGKLLAGLTRIDRGVLLALLSLAAATALTNSELLLRLYPAAVNLGLLLLFGLSLLSPCSMVERFARLREPNLPPSGVRYTRRITQVWCVFFAGNGSFAAWTALYATRDQWALYNGLIAYLLMGGLFTGEWVIRRFYQVRQQP